MGVSGQRHAPADLPPGKTLYPLYRRLGGPQGWSGQVQKIWSPPGFDSQTVQPIASRYTDSSLPAHTSMYEVQIIFRSVTHKMYRGLTLPSNSSKTAQ